LAAETRLQAEEWIKALQAAIGLLPRQTTPTKRSSGSSRPSLSILPNAAPVPHRTVPTSPQFQAQQQFQTQQQQQLSQQQRAMTWQQRMFTAVQAGDVEKLEEVLNNGAFIDTIFDQQTKDTPLIIASRMGHVNVMRLCLQFGAKNDPYPEFGCTALHAACASGQYDAAAVLLQAASKAKADHIICNLPDSAGRTPLHLAAAHGNSELLELLVNHGVDLSKQDAKGATCLHLCADKGHNTSIAVLIDQLNVEDLIDVVDSAGNTALHIAVIQNQKTSVRLLLQSAANVQIRNKAGHRPLDLAVANSLTAIGSLLLEYESWESDFMSKELEAAAKAAAEAEIVAAQIAKEEAEMEAAVLASVQQQFLVKVKEFRNSHRGSSLGGGGGVGGGVDGEEKGEEEQEEEEARAVDDAFIESFVWGQAMWRVYLTEEGHSYFVAPSGESQWDDPRASFADFGLIDEEREAVSAPPSRSGEAQEEVEIFEPKKIVFAENEEMVEVEAEEKENEHKETREEEMGVFREESTPSHHEVEEVKMDQISPDLSDAGQKQERVEEEERKVEEVTMSSLSVEAKEDRTTHVGENTEERWLLTHSPFDDTDESAAAIVRLLCSGSENVATAIDSEPPSTATTSTSDSSFESEFERFFAMQRRGLPLGHILNKMKLENTDPSKIKFFEQRCLGQKEGEIKHREEEKCERGDDVAGLEGEARESRGEE